MWILNSEDKISEVYYFNHWYSDEFMQSKNYTRLIYIKDFLQSISFSWLCQLL